MAAASIGIKLADSKFFPVLEEGIPARKALDLTTVRDDQTSVQINLFRSSSEDISEAEYVGTLMIE
ncbi:MAG: peptidoglycan-binding protein, partial [Spirochaetales bacterium]|nr:peptidoglycan-binding protein [Spirochaetales bacterium]